MAAVLMPHATGAGWFTWRLQRSARCWAPAEQLTVGEVEDTLGGLPLAAGATVETRGAPPACPAREARRSWPAWFVTIRAGDTEQLFALAGEVATRLIVAGLTEGIPDPAQTQTGAGGGASPARRPSAAPQGQRASP